jgi:two-component system, NtrC family, sensor kinase
MINPFPTIHPIYLLYLSYGAAFLVLGLSISIKDMKGSDLRLADNLWLLGMFGFTHGVREWIEIYPLIEGEHLSLLEIFQTKFVSDVMMIISFLFLLQFGLSLIHDDKRSWLKWLKGVPIALFVIWALIIWVQWMHGFSTNMLFLRHIETGARNTFGLIGGFATAYGLITYSHEIKNLSNYIARNLFFAGVVFAFYGVFASNYFSNFAYFVLPVPAEIFRGGSAVLITYFVVKALNIFDVETRRRIEQQTRQLVQAEKLSSLGQLAAGIAHEINNPLTNVSLGIQTLKGRLNSGAENEIMDKLNVMERNIDRASAIAQELLQFSRQKEFEFVPLNINNVIKGSLTLMKHKLSAVAIEQDLASVPDVMGDSGKLEQVFINVLANAAEAMGEGGRISLFTAHHNGMVEACITDSGPGIKAENISRVFDPFFTTKEIGSGTGLGLSICYGIINQHHGSIQVSSTVGLGTTVTIKIPTRE